MSAEIEVFMQKRHRCPACRKSWASPTRARRHYELGCLLDPATHSCKTCVHFDAGYELDEISSKTCVYLDAGYGLDDLTIEGGGYVPDTCGLALADLTIHPDDWPRDCKGWEQKT